MRKFLIVRDPIELKVDEITEIKEKTWQIRPGHCLVILRDGTEVEVLEEDDKEIKIGDLVHYSVQVDEFRLFDPQMTLPPYSRLVEVLSE